jgi:hypothetical protein
MKTIVFDSPYQESVSVVAAGGAKFERGVPTAVDDKTAKICLKNPHFRLDTEKTTAFQVTLAEREAAEKAANDADDSEAEVAETNKAAAQSTASVTATNATHASLSNTKQQ